MTKQDLIDEMAEEFGQLTKNDWILVAGKYKDCYDNARFIIEGKDRTIHQQSEALIKMRRELAKMKRNHETPANDTSTTKKQ